MKALAKAVETTTKKKERNMTPFEMVVFEQLDQGRRSVAQIAKHLNIPGEYVLRSIKAMTKLGWMTDTDDGYTCEHCNGSYNDWTGTCPLCGVCCECGEVHGDQPQSGPQLVN